LRFWEGPLSGANQGRASLKVKVNAAVKDLVRKGLTAATFDATSGHLSRIALALEGSRLNFCQIDTSLGGHFFETEVRSFDHQWRRRGRWLLFHCLQLTKASHFAFPIQAKLSSFIKR
jgi:hypothetical protein